MGVGIGEAGGVAPSYALISDSFPPHQRGRALAIFSFGIPIGSALGIFFGGWIASHIDWRAAFIIVGLAGLILAPLVKFGVPEAPRGALDGVRIEAAASLAEDRKSAVEGKSVSVRVHLEGRRRHTKK